MLHTQDDLKTAVIDIYSALNVIYEGCPATTRRWVFEQALIFTPRRSWRASSWSEFTVEELREAAALMRQRHVPSAMIYAEVAR